MPQRWAIVGGGLLGLSLALDLASEDRHITIIEAAPQIGGLASTWQLGPVTWDRHYHVVLLSDMHTRSLLEQLGLDDLTSRDRQGADSAQSTMRWSTPKTGFYDGQRLQPFNSALDYLRLRALNPVDKARLATTILYASRVENWQRLEHIPVETWLTKLGGRRVFDRLWRPLLRAKLGDSWNQTNAAFIWATIQRLYAAQASGLKQQRFGIPHGGYATVFDALANKLNELGVDIRTSTSVQSVHRTNNQLRIQSTPSPACGGGVTRSVTEGVPLASSPIPAGEVPSEARRRGSSPSLQSFDRVILTTPPQTTARICPDLCAQERQQLGNINYQGIVCASVLLDQPLTENYLTYITDESIPFTTIIDMTALTGADQFDGYGLIYLPRYTTPDDPIFDEPDESIRERFLEAAERIYPALGKRTIEAFRVSRVKSVFAVPALDFSNKLPDPTTSVPGLTLVSSAWIPNAPLNVNDTLALGKRAACSLLASDGMDIDLSNSSDSLTNEPRPSGSGPDKLR